MHHFKYSKGELHCEGVPIGDLVEEHGSPLYVYSRQTLLDHFSRLDKALTDLDHMICYAVKANSNLAVLNTLASQSSGFDVVSEGELMRVLSAGGRAGQCVFAGVGKTEQEIEFALRKGIYAINAESIPELERIDRVAARLKRKAPVSLRVNPNVDAKTHAKITTGTYENKFGVPYEEIEGLYARMSRMKHLSIRGVQMHIGSQLTQVKPFVDAVRKMVPLVRNLKEAHALESFSIGGGIGIVYDPALASGSAKWWKREEAKGILTPELYAQKLLPLLKPLGLRILLEPGRFIAGNAGILVTRVEYVKNTGKKHFVIVDAAMNDLIRPAFYEAYHEIVPIVRKRGQHVMADVVGPICESGDTFCKGRPLPRMKEGDYLAMLSAGAYAFTMASNYNTRSMPAEILVHGAKHALVRKRQSIRSLWRQERVPVWE
jgi:diaminopimelate decarboxylase